MIDESIDVTRSGERGTALVMVLLILALLLTLVMASSLTAISESGVSNTYGTQTIALQAAESGLNHAASLVMNFTPTTTGITADFTGLLALRSNTTSLIDNEGKPPFPMSAADFMAGSQMIVATDATGQPIYVNGALAPATEANGYALRDASNNVVAGAFYSVRLIDDQPTGTATPSVPNFNPGSTYSEVTSPNGNNPAIDKNNRVVIYSTGRYGNASVTLEGWIAFLPYPALSAEGNIQVSGNTMVNGIYGGVHSNANLILAQGGGNNWWVEQTFTATNQIVGDATGHVGGFFGGGQEPLYIPPFVTTAPLTTGGPKTNPRLQEFLIRKADRILMDPNYADGAHGSNEFESGSGNGVVKTQSLSTLARRLNIPYQMFVNAIDADPDRGNRIQQPSAIALEVTRDNAGTATSVVKRTPSEVGWAYSGTTNASWGIDTNANGLLASGKTYYVIGMDNYSSNLPNGGNVSLTGNVGSSTQALRVTILASGSIQIAGTPNITANLENLSTTLLPPFVSPNMLMVAVQDIKVTGDNNSAIKFTGVSFAGEQVELSSSGDINGQVISLSNPNVPGTPVSINNISGRFTLTLNDGKSIGRVKLYSWRQIKR